MTLKDFQNKQAGAKLHPAEWDVKWLPIERLQPYARNPRRNEQTIPRLQESIKRFGFKVPLVIGKDGIVVTGHTRLKAALLLGFTKLPTVDASDLSEDELDALRLIDNKISELSEWDFGMLDEQLEELKTDFDGAMEAFGFGEFTNGGVDDLFDPDNQKDHSGGMDGEKKPKVVRGVCPCCGEEFEVEVSKSDITDEDLTPNKVLD